MSKSNRKYRQVISLAASDLVEESRLSAEGVSIFSPRDFSIDLASWASANQTLILDKLRISGGILFRGFGITTLELFERIASVLCEDLMEYTYRSTPRTKLFKGVYTSTEYPADQKILQHNENSYAATWPLYIAFACIDPPSVGGETPTADSRRVYGRIPTAIRERFASKGVRYVRNYGAYLDLKWQEVFQTDDPKQVELICRQSNISYEWKPDGGLRTTQVCNAIARHPTTNDLVWFNQAHLFHISALPPRVRDYVVKGLGADNVPRNAYYGDGTPIEDEVIHNIRQIYEQEEVSMPWAHGDILLLDNMLRTHGRLPYQGNRKILVAMGKQIQQS
jgi:alpha-ketoglutarate-dependent taurine dioxygenase